MKRFHFTATLPVLVLAFVLLLGASTRCELEENRFPQRVHDNANLLSSLEAGQIERRIVEIRTGGGPDIGIMTIQKSPQQGLDSFSRNQLAQLANSTHGSAASRVVLLVISVEEKEIMLLQEQRDGLPEHPLPKAQLESELRAAFRRSLYHAGLLDFLSSFNQ